MLCSWLAGVELSELRSNRQATFTRGVHLVSFGKFNRNYTCFYVVLVKKIYGHKVNQQVLIETAHMSDLS